MDCIGTKNVRQVLEYKARLFGSRECLVFEDAEGYVVSYTYRAFDEMVNRYANVLLRNGIKKGDKVTIHLANAPEYLLCFFALAKIGAIIIPTNILSGAPEMEYFIDFSDSVGIITEPRYMDLIGSIRGTCKKLQQIFLVRTSPWYPNDRLYPDTTIITDELKDAAATLTEVSIDVEDDLMMLFNHDPSRPKAVEITHANAVFAGIFGAQAWKVVPEDRHLLTLPLFHINALFISLMPALTAGAAVILAEQFNASRYMEQVRRHRATTASLVGAMVRMILKEPATERDADNNLRFIIFAIAVTDEEWDAFESRFQVRLCDIWGMTETLGATTINPIDGIMKKNCVGLPRLSNAVKVVDKNSADVRTTGELVVQGVPGRTIMKGYYKNADATRETVRDGWLHTGDYAYMDADGYFHFAGMRKETAV
ncbi:MAG: AMP-binding protein [Proteobacteria bacterium]|nr:AMP-binding protein [Pseudomonadota bacterium]